MDSEEEQYGAEVSGRGEHLSIRSMPSDAEVTAHHQLRAGRSTWPLEKNT